MKTSRLTIVVAFLLALTQIVFSGQDKATQDLRERAVQLMAQLERATSMKFKHEINVGIYSREQLKDFLIRDVRANLSESKAHALEKIGRKFGFFPKNFDLIKTYVDLLCEYLAGFYHPRSKELKIVRDTPQLQLDERAQEQELGVKMRDVYLYHELFHGLQDQWFDLLPLKTGDDKNDDRQLAFDSLIEGEATCIHLAYKYQKFQARADRWKAREAQEPAEWPEKYPRYLFRPLTFPYTVGFGFVDRCLREKKWKTASAMFEDIPLSSEQILHPEKYLDEPRDYPVSITMRFAKMNDVLGDNWQRLDDNVHGEYVIRLLFEEFGMRDQGLKAASGWGGDRYTVYERPADGRTLMIWFTNWDTEKDAGKFQVAYTDLLRRKYPRLSQVEEIDGRTIYRTIGEGLVVLDRRGLDLLIIEGADEVDLKVLPVVWQTVRKEKMREWKRPKVIYM